MQAEEYRRADTCLSSDTQRGTRNNRRDTHPVFVVVRGNTRDCDKRHKGLDDAKLENALLDEPQKLQVVREGRQAACAGEPHGYVFSTMQRRQNRGFASEILKTQ